MASMAQIYPLRVYGPDGGAKCNAVSLARDLAGNSRRDEHLVGSGPPITHDQIGIEELSPVSVFAKSCTDELASHAIPIEVIVELAVGARALPQGVAVAEFLPLPFLDLDRRESPTRQILHGHLIGERYTRPLRCVAREDVPVERLARQLLPWKGVAGANEVRTHERSKHKAGL